MARPELILKTSEIEDILKYYSVNHSVRETAKITGHGRDKIKKILLDCGIDIDPLSAKRFDMMENFIENAQKASIITGAYLDRQIQRMDENSEGFLDSMRPEHLQQLQIIQGVSLDSVRKLRDRGEKEEAVIEVESRNVDAIEHILHKEGRSENLFEPVDYDGEDQKEEINTLLKNDTLSKATQDSDQEEQGYISNKSLKDKGSILKDYDDEIDENNIPF
jgi:hypothetical protein